MVITDHLVIECYTTNWQISVPHHMLWNFRSFYPSLSFHPLFIPLHQNKESLDIIQDKAIKRQESKGYYRTVNHTKRLSRVRCFTVPGLSHYKLGAVLLVWIPVPLWETKAKIYYPIEKEFSTKDKWGRCWRKGSGPRKRITWSRTTLRSMALAAVGRHCPTL